MKKELFPSLMLIFAASLWGLGFPIQSLAADLGTFTVTFFKSSAALLLVILAYIKKEKVNYTTICGGIAVGAVSTFACAFQQKGLELTSAANTSFITSLYLVLVPVLSIFLGKKIKKRLWFAIAISLIGMYLLCLDGSFKINIGDVIVLVCAFLFAIQIILIDKFVAKVEILSFVAVQQITSLIITGILMFIIEKPQLTMLIKFWPNIIYISLISGALAMFIQNRFQRDLNPSLASLLMSLESVFGALFGWLILNQTLSIREICGCVLIFIAILLAE